MRLDLPDASSDSQPVCPEVSYHEQVTRLNIVAFLILFLFLLFFPFPFPSCSFLTSTLLSSVSFVFLFIISSSISCFCHLYFFSILLIRCLSNASFILSACLLTAFFPPPAQSFTHPSRVPTCLPSVLQPCLPLFAHIGSRLTLKW